MPDSGLFDQMLTEIQSKVMARPTKGRLRGGFPGNVYLLYPFMNWSWRAPQSGQIAAQAYGFANTIPQWSGNSFYMPSDSTVYSCYRELLFQVNLSVPPEKQGQIDGARADLLRAILKHEADQATMRLNWNAHVGSSPPGSTTDYEAWKSEHGWTALLALDHDQIKLHTDAYGGLITQTNPAYLDALRAVTPPPAGVRKLGWTMVDQGDGTLVPAPDWTIGMPGQDWVAEVVQGNNPVTIEFDSSQRLPQLPGAPSTASPPPFWSVLLNGAWKPLDLSSDPTVTATITMKGSARVPVNPSDYWYNSGFLRRLAADRNAFNPPFSPTGTEAIFGRGGLLPLRITGMVIGYQPDYRITMSEGSVTQIGSLLQAAQGLRIGSFQFGGEENPANTWKMSVAQTTIEGSSQSPYPVILAVTVTQPGLDTM